MSSAAAVVGIIIVVVILLIFMVSCVALISIWAKRMETMVGKDAPESKRTLTPTQKFILAASSPTIGNNYKCVIEDRKSVV